MIRFELLRDRRILLITPDGPLQRADFEQLAKEIDPCTATNGKLVDVMIQAKSLPGWHVSHLSSSPIIIDKFNVKQPSPTAGS